MPPKQALLCFMNSVSENGTGSNRGGLSMLPDVWGLTWEDSKAVDVPVVGGWVIWRDLYSHLVVRCWLLSGTSAGLSAQTPTHGLSMWTGVGFLKLACSSDARESVQEGKAQCVLFSQSSLRSYRASGLPWLSSD